ncbi:MAG: aromatic ring-opening dioxygenase LigB subunit [Limisphaerales bacterium]|jgi:aromatic ring-opening dioxygenase LigB subunit
MNSSSPEAGIVFAGLMPHAPVLIPEVGQGREREAASTVAAMREISARLVSLNPDRLVLISPHSPRRHNSFGIWGEASIAGDLGRFRCPDVRIDLPVDSHFADRIHTDALPTWRIRDEALDHGASVPGYFLARAGWQGATTLLSLNYPGVGMLEDLGTLLAKCADESGGTTAVIASGDMSHALLEGGAAGFHPRAREFDECFVGLVKDCDYGGLASIDPSLLEVAAEDVVGSTLIACASVGMKSEGANFMSYEGPFGVGYSVAVLFDRESS